MVEVSGKAETDRIIEKDIVMKLNIYSIYDKAVQAYMRPFFLQADSAAKRAFGDLVVDADHEISKHPEDYALFRIGEFDDGTGELDQCEPLCLARAHEIAAESRARSARQLELVEEKEQVNA